MPNIGYAVVGNCEVLFVARGFSDARGNIAWIVVPRDETSRPSASSKQVIMATALTNGDAPNAPIEVSFPLPKAPHTNIHLQLTNNGPNLLLFLTSSTPESTTSSVLGSFVYAMPNVSSYRKFLYGSTYISKAASLANDTVESLSLKSAKYATFHPQQHA